MTIIVLKIRQRRDVLESDKTFYVNINVAMF